MLQIRATFLQLGAADTLVSALRTAMAGGHDDDDNDGEGGAAVVENVLAALRNFTVGSDRVRHAVIRAGLVPLL